MDIQSKIHELKHTKLVEAGDDGGDGWKRVEASTGGWKWVETGGEGWEPAETGVKPLQVQEFAREQDDVRRWVWHQARGGGGQACLITKQVSGRWDTRSRTPVWCAQ